MDEDRAVEIGMILRGSLTHAELNGMSSIPVERFPEYAARFRAGNFLRVFAPPPAQIRAFRKLHDHLKENDLYVDHVLVDPNSVVCLSHGDVIMIVENLEDAKTTGYERCISAITASGCAVQIAIDISPHEAARLSSPSADGTVEILYLPYFVPLDVPIIPWTQ